MSYVAEPVEVRAEELSGAGARAEAETGIRTELSTKTTVRFLTPEEWTASYVQEAWRRRMAESTNPNLLFQSPEWLENKHVTKRENLRLAVVEENGRITGMAPLLVGQQVFDLRLGRMRLRTAQVLGGEGLMPEAAYEGFFAAIFTNFEVDGIHFRLLARESGCWRALQATKAGRVSVGDELEMYSVELPGSLEAYLMTRGDSSHRKRLRRCLKLRREEGELRLERIRRPEQVAEFLRAGSRVARASWQAARADYLIEETPEWNTHLTDLARRGILRSYLLWCNETPCAYGLGVQGEGTYYGSLLGYDPAMAKLSPGTTLLITVIEDLIEHDRPKRFNLGEGEDAYKRRLATSSVPVVNVTLLRRSVRGTAAAAVLNLYGMARRLRRPAKKTQAERRECPHGAARKGGMR